MQTRYCWGVLAVCGVLVPANYPVVANAEQVSASTKADRTDAFSNPRDSANWFSKDQSIDEQPYLFKSDSLEMFYKNLDESRKSLHEATGLKYGFMHSHLFQAATDSLPDQDHVGFATITALYGQWDLLNTGTATAGQINFGVEARWGYGDLLTPSELGFAGIGSATGTADPYGATDPAIVLREVFWRQGSPEAGWSYRIGKITTDRLLGTSDFIDPVSLGFPVGSQGASSIALPDSGLGMAAAVYPNDRFRMGVVISDANGDRTNFGDIGKGDLFKAIEFQAQIIPQFTENAGFSTFTLWHSDGTSDRQPMGSSTGADGWGFFVKLEQELTPDGQNIGIVRFGKSYDGAAVYKAQASVRYVRVDPPDPFDLSDDRFGIALSWVDPVGNTTGRGEYSVDTFYRFNLFQKIETSVGYQAIFDPVFNPYDDFISVFSLRLTQFL